MCNDKDLTPETITSAMVTLSKLTGFSDIDAKTYSILEQIIDRTQRHIAREAEEGHTTEYRLGAAEEILRIVLRDLKELVE